MQSLGLTFIIYSFYVTYVESVGCFVAFWRLHLVNSPVKALLYLALVPIITISCATGDNSWTDVSHTTSGTDACVVCEVRCLCALAPMGHPARVMASGHKDCPLEVACSWCFRTLSEPRHGWSRTPSGPSSPFSRSSLPLPIQHFRFPFWFLVPTFGPDRLFDPVWPAFV